MFAISEAVTQISVTFTRNRGKTRVSQLQAILPALLSLDRYLHAIKNRKLSMPSLVERKKLEGVAWFETMSASASVNDVSSRNNMISRCRVCS